MSTNRDQISPTEFIERLKAGVPPSEEPISIEGIVKLSDEAELLVSISGDCEDWIAVPIDVVESIAQRGNHRCGDHSYVVARIVLRDEGAPSGEFFRALFLAAVKALGPASGIGGSATAFRATDEWGDPIPPPGCKKRCGPAVCPNPSGRGTIWCTKCWIECPTPAPELSSYYRIGW